MEEALIAESVYTAVGTVSTMDGRLIKGEWESNPERKLMLGWATLE